MLDLLTILVNSLVTKISDPLVFILIAICGYFGWDRYQMSKQVQQQQQQLAELVASFQTTLTERSQEEKRQLLDIIDQYHKSQLTLTDALNQIKLVLANMGAKV